MFFTYARKATGKTVALQGGMVAYESRDLSLHLERREEDWATKSNRAGQQRRASIWIVAGASRDLLLSTELRPSSMRSATGNHPEVQGKQL